MVVLEIDLKVILPRLNYWLPLLTKKYLFFFSSSSSSSSSSSVCVAGGNPAYRNSAFDAVCTLTPVLVPPFISRSAPRQTA
jgi:hypothetical protein